MPPVRVLELLYKFCAFAYIYLLLYDYLNRTSCAFKRFLIFHIRRGAAVQCSILSAMVVGSISTQGNKLFRFF